MMSDLPAKTRKVVAEQLGQLLLSNIELTTQLQDTMAELGKLKSEAAAPKGRKKVAAPPGKILGTVDMKANGRARAN